MQYDHVDRLLVQWLQQRPDLDCSPMGVLGRISRMSRIVDKKLDKTFKNNDLSAIEFDILAALRRFNSLTTPTELYQTLMLSSGAMSTRVEQLVQRDLIERIYSEEDRRSCNLSLTKKGKSLIDKAISEHVANEDEILNPLSQEQREQLASLLRSWLLANEK
ncbi:MULTISPECIES: MarR family winged helix-turn-helix transcriptional regulator [Pantoea]|uniref:MarR family transcriptional regulator n=1 Tax=Pantoea trifolii TaxID=2968030 RepID=A0ABT1VQ99_9GAMM|nr:MULTISPECIES: MarR family transcriptional regulator [unclassified Pantoea]MCQ8229717.1 MarR family transcriptional regulator [Pantoea sp. MMK2]MCQ8238433.1 MarR family transcriptional regulator [Pantoea sp. MMK3]MCW6033712.1 MarR family transcriptional regulator [Pantoea sp. JK]